MHSSPGGSHPYNNLYPYNIYISLESLGQDKNNDTLLYAGVAKVNITDWFFLKDKVVLEYIGLENTRILAHRTDSVWNYQFLIDYFSSPSTKEKKKSIELDLKKIAGILLIGFNINKRIKTNKYQWYQYRKQREPERRQLCILFYRIHFYVF